jgi:hypothetical protein
MVTFRTGSHTYTGSPGDTEMVKGPGGRPAFCHSDRPGERDAVASDEVDWRGFDSVSPCPQLGCDLFCFSASTFATQSGSPVALHQPLVHEEVEEVLGQSDPLVSVNRKVTEGGVVEHGLTRHVARRRRRGVAHL